MVYRIKLVFAVRILCECERIDEVNIQRTENSERDEGNEGMVVNIGCDDDDDDDVENAISFDL